MQIKNLFAIATLTMALTGTVFGQWHPDFDIVKGRQAKVQSVKSPRDVATGQSSGKSAREAGSGMATGRRPYGSVAKRARGFMDYTDDSVVTQVQPGQNSGGTISNQRHRQVSPKIKGYTNGGVEHEDTWEHSAKTARKRK